MPDLHLATKTKSEAPASAAPDATLDQLRNAADAIYDAVRALNRALILGNRAGLSTAVKAKYNDLLGLTMVETHVSVPLHEER